MGMHKEFNIEYCTMLFHSQTLCLACSVQLDMAVCQRREEQSGELFLGHIAVVGTTMVKWQQTSKYPRIPQAPLNRPHTEGLCRGSYGSRLLASKLPSGL